MLSHWLQCDVGQLMDEARSRHGIDRGAALASYVYRPLAKGAIRILVLKSGRNGYE